MLTSVIKGVKYGQAFLVMLIALALFAVPVLAGTGADHEHNGSAVNQPEWLNKLENQVNYEEMMSGMEGRQEKLDKTFMQLMDRLQGKIKELINYIIALEGFVKKYRSLESTVRDDNEKM